MRLFAVIAGLLLSAIVNAATLEITVQHPVMDSEGRPLIGDFALIDWKAEYSRCGDPFVPWGSKVKVIGVTTITFSNLPRRQYCARIKWRNKFGEVKTQSSQPDPRAGAILSFTVRP